MGGNVCVMLWAQCWLPDFIWQVVNVLRQAMKTCTLGSGECRLGATSRFTSELLACMLSRTSLPAYVFHRFEFLAG